MKVLIAEKRGFCFGVQRAIRKATEALGEHGSVYSLGPVIHNPQVVEQLRQQGLIVVDRVEDIPRGSAMLIRSHGLPQETIERARQRDVQIVDATCPLVKRAQHIVAHLHQEGYKVIMIGDPNHPEVKGIVGYAPDVTVVRTGEDLTRLTTNEKFGVVCQTTLSRQHAAQVISRIVRRGFKELRIVDTLCNEANLRQQSALELCKRVDVMFVLGGLQSSNTRELANLCRQQNVRTFHLEDRHGLKHEMVENCTSAGITAGASTPDWIVHDCARILESL